MFKNYNFLAAWLLLLSFSNKLCYAWNSSLFREWHVSSWIMLNWCFGVLPNKQGTSYYVKTCYFLLHCNTVFQLSNAQTYTNKLFALLLGYLFLMFVFCAVHFPLQVVLPMAVPGALGLMSATVFAASEAKENNTTLKTDEVLPVKFVLGWSGWERGGYLLDVKCF